MVFGGGPEVDVADLDVVSSVDEDELFYYFDVCFNKESNIEPITSPKCIRSFIIPP